MYNIVCYDDLAAAGVNTTLIRRAKNCCLVKICRGVYSVVRQCKDPKHSAIAVFGTDREWMRYHEQGLHKEKSHRRRYLDHLARLRTLHYPHYRNDDVIWGVSAARLHKIKLFDVTDGPVTVSHPKANSSSRELIRSRRTLVAADRQIVDGLAVTTVARTAVDLIRILGPASGFVALEQVLREHMFGSDEESVFSFGYPRDALTRVPEAVDELFAATIGRLATGKIQARTLISAIRPYSESYAESRASLNLHQLGLRDFSQQIDIFDGHRLLTRLDFLHRATKVVLYVDGTQKYVDAGFDRMNKESHQHNRLLAMGYKVVRFRFNELLSLGAFANKLFGQAPELRGFCGNKLVV